MPNRRQFVKASATVALLHTPARVFSSSAHGVSMPPSTSIIYDVRYPESQAFATQAARLGACVRGIRGDITELWYELTSAGRGTLGPLAGLTQGSEFLLLHRICIERGYRLAYHGEHTYHGGGTPRIEHRLRAPAQLAAIEKSMANSGGNWAKEIAEIVTRAEADHRMDCTFVCDAPLTRPTRSPGHFVSWILMPPASNARAG